MGERLLGEPVRPHDFLFLRCAGLGKATGIHCDSPFFMRLTAQVVTCWCALGPVPLEDGPLLILDGSHRDPGVLDRFRGFDVARDRDRKATFSEDAVTLAERHGWRILSADFDAGDVIDFGMFTLHGSLDNHSPTRRVRVSASSRPPRPSTRTISGRRRRAPPGPAMASSTPPSR
jgi:ectoine hydroxylase-related dioxygenase (phytanoyl-CoA dioxygenase family)